MITRFTSDLHFGDDAVLRYDAEPMFSNIEVHDSYIVNNWNELIKDDDLVYILGDIGSDRDLVYEKFRLLKGRKRIVLGNHDRTQTFEDVNWYRLLHGVEEVYDKPIILNGFVILSHKPLFMNNHMPFFNIFGHVHNHPAFVTESDHSLCACVQRNNYTPVQCDVFNRFNESPLVEF